MVAGDLDALIRSGGNAFRGGLFGECRKAVEGVLRVLLHDPNGQSVPGKDLRPRLGLEPERDVALDLERDAQLRHQLGQPRTGSNQDLGRVVGAARRGHGHSTCAAGVERPARDAFLEVQLSAASDREAQVRGDAALREEQAGERLVQRLHVVVDLKRRKTRARLVRVEQLVVQPVSFGTQQRAVEHVAAAPADVQPTRDLEQVVVRLLFDLRPQFPGRLEQRHVRRDARNRRGG